MKVLISGASGFIGKRLVRELGAQGHAVTRLVRRTPGAGEAAWDPAAGSIDAAALEGLDAAVHLAGESIAARRWSPAQKARIRDSRVMGTRLLAEALGRARSRPGTLLTASAIGYYGDRGEAPLDEDSGPGRGFLAEVCQAWEEAASPARAAGIRVAHARLGVVLAREDGALAKMLTPFRLGLGGPIGDGRQYWSWVTAGDVVSALLHMLNDRSLAGPVNVTAPAPVTNAEFTRALGRALGRPAFLPMPGFAARLLLGEMAEALLLASARVEPKRLLGAGFQFRHPGLEEALRAVLAADTST